MSVSTTKLYTDKFYAGQVDGSVLSAKVILQFIFNIYKPLSVVDVGCGKGSWLSVAESLGSNKLQGYDGDWVSKSSLISKQINFTAVNFENAINITGKYDLAISLEVAEHITVNNSDSFVEGLCVSSDIILFGAAIKYQGGTGHINEQPQSYWIEKFKKYGYECFDIIRPFVWDNDDVEIWYRQNTFLFVKRSCNKVDKRMLRAMEESIYDIVHPIAFKQRSKLLYNPELHEVLRYLKVYFIKSIKRHKRV